MNVEEPAEREPAERLIELLQVAGIEDDDVLGMFKMREPGDAALAGNDPMSRQLGVVDQRIESWFRPFGGIVPTGYIGE